MKTETCWLWLLSRTGGYGAFWHQGTMQRAHIYAWTLEHGPVPEGFELDHLCRVKHCVRAEHLEVVTHRENVRRGQSITTINAAKVACPWGHPYDEKNTRHTQGRRR